MILIIKTLITKTLIVILYYFVSKNFYNLKNLNFFNLVNLSDINFISFKRS